MKISGWWRADVWRVQFGRHSPNLGCQVICKEPWEHSQALYSDVWWQHFWSAWQMKFGLHVMYFFYLLFAWLCFSMHTTCPKLPAVLCICRSGASWSITHSLWQAFVHNLPWPGQNRMPSETEGILCQGSEQRTHQLEETQWDRKRLDQCLHPCRGSSLIGDLICFVGEAAIDCKPDSSL